MNRLLDLLISIMPYCYKNVKLNICNHLTPLTSKIHLFTTKKPPKYGGSELLFHSTHDKGDVVKLFIVERTHVFYDIVELFGVIIFLLKKFLGCYLEVFADVKEALHRREGVFVLYAVDITAVLPYGQTHGAGRYFLLLSQCGKSLRKKIFIQTNHHPLL